MNTLEKRKLEAVVVSRLQAAREAYRTRREREHQELIKKAEAKPPVAIQKFSEKARAAVKAQKDKEVAAREAAKEMDKLIESLSSQAEKLGYNISKQYDGEIVVSLERTVEWTGRYKNTPVYTYSEPSLSQHSKDSADRLQKLDDLADRYTITIWSEGEDMSNIADRLAKDLAELTA